MKRLLVKISHIIDIILIVSVVLTTMALINVSNNNLSDTRRQYTGDFMHIIELVIDDCIENEIMSGLGENVIAYIDSNPNKIVEIYNEEYQQDQLISYKSDYIIDINEYPNLLEAIDNNEFGFEVIILNDSREEIYFKWITAADGSKRLVLLYAINDEVFNYSYISSYGYTILILVAILVTKILLSTRRINIKFLENMNRRSRK